MLKILKVAFAVIGCLVFAGAIAGAQEVIHAMTGTVRSIDTAQKSFTLYRDGGSLITFKDMTGSKTQIDKDRKILSDATSAETFGKKDAYVIVFYYGMGDDPTGVAIRALGTGPFVATVGTVTNFNGREGLVSVKDGSGAIHSYKINADTVAESDFGVVEGLKIRPEKGGHIRVVGAVNKDTATALFLNLM